MSDNCRIVVMDSSNPAVIGSKNYFGMGCRIVLRAAFQMGDGNLVADNVSIYDHNHDYKGCNGGFVSKAIEIGNNCWLATNVVVTAGSKIENRVIVGANSVVGGKLELNSLYVAPRASRIMKL